MSQSNVTVQVYSFGYHRSGIPQDSTGNNGGFVFDCRHLPNPGREKQYKHQTGQDQSVIDYLRQRPIVEEFLQDVFKITLRAILAYQERGFSDIMISMGCTGGQHRSIYSAERLNKFLRSKNINTILRHRELAEIPSRYTDQPRLDDAVGSNRGACAGKCGCHHRKNYFL